MVRRRVRRKRDPLGEQVGWEETEFEGKTQD